jgi:hypothetical protein
MIILKYYWRIHIDPNGTEALLREINMLHPFQADLNQLKKECGTYYMP